MIGYQVEIKGLDEAIKTFGNADKIIQHEFSLAMDQSVKTISGSAKKLAPVGVSGELRASISDEVKNVGAHDVQGMVGSPLPYAIYVEMGTKPHYPPLAPLILWVERVIQPGDDKVIGIARAIQRKIGRVGTKPREFFKAAFEGSQDKIYGYFDRALTRIVERLAKE
jgi:HK97 gp10 family phage protein